MDIKLKEKKFSLKIVVLLLSVCLSLIITLSLFAKSKFNESSPYEVEDQRLSFILSQIYNNVDDLMLYTDGLYGEIREDSVEAEFKNIKDNIELSKREQDMSGIYNEYYYMTDAEIKKKIIENFKMHIQNRMEGIEGYKNIEFYCESENGELHFTNTNSESKEEFEQDTRENYKEYILLKSNSKIETSKNLEKIVYCIQNLDRNHDFYIRLSNPLNEGDYVYEIIKGYESGIIQGYVSIGLLVIAAIGAIVCFVKLLKRDVSSILKVKIIDLLGKLDIEVKLLLLLGMVLSEIKSLKDVGYIFNFVVNFIIIAICLYLFILEVIRIRASYNKVKELVLSESILIRAIKCFKESKFYIVVLFIMINIIIEANLFVVFMMLCRHSIDGIFGSLIATLLLDGKILVIINSINKIEIKSNNIANGVYDEDINVNGLKVLRNIDTNLKNIQNGLKESVDKAVKSERMKSELITNVSHDLKTPLTSIINYVDLLNQENITEEQRKKYLGILKDKSNRLKALIEDLFEVSKASSGSMKLDMQDLDPVALLRQTLGEFQDKIENSNLKIIKKIPEEKLVVYADGRKTFRVFQNLLSNIFKYSMEGSRVYIEVSDAGQYVEVIFKNTSKEELNFTEEEILQRFKRGDASRTTEGSGLGLAIAKSLTEVQEGIFDIKIDGDLFKAIVKLKKEK